MPIHRSRWNAVVIRTLLAAICIGAAARPEGGLADDEGTSSVLTDTMTRMLDAMTAPASKAAAKVADDLGQGRPPIPRDRSELNEMMPGANSLSDQWFGGFCNPLWEYVLPRQLTRTRSKLDTGITTLDGIWEGRDDGLLIVVGSRFRLYQSCGGSIDGLIQQRGNRIALYDPANQDARSFEFAEYQGRLTLRDGAGQLFLYRRLWLDQDFTNPFEADPLEQSTQ